MKDETRQKHRECEHTHHISIKMKTPNPHGCSEPLRASSNLEKEGKKSLQQRIGKKQTRDEVGSERGMRFAGAMALIRHCDTNQKEHLDADAASV